MAPFLLPCAHCHCHAKSAEVTCPSCGEPLRRNDGSVPRTAAAVLLGLTAAGALAGSCGARSGLDDGTGPAPTTTSSGAGGAGGAASTSASTTSNTSGMSSTSSGTTVFYGPAPTTSATGSSTAGTGTSTSGSGGSSGG